MFKNLGLFSGLPCPVKKCNTIGCFFKHRFVSEEPERPTKRRRVSETLGRASGQVIGPSTKDRDNDLLHRALGRPSEAGNMQADTNAQDVLLTSCEKKLVEVPPIETAKTLISDPRYIARGAVDDQITIRYEPTVPVPHESRLYYLRAYKKQFERIYTPLRNFRDYDAWITQDSIAQERAVLQRSGKGIYKQASKNMLIKLGKRGFSTGPDDRGIFPDYKPPLPVPDLSSLVHTEEMLIKAGFLTSIPEPDATMKNEEGQDRICDRCGQRFIVSANPTEWSSCTYHPGKSSRMGKSGVRTRQWSCCITEGPGCVVAKSHVFKVSHELRLAAYHPFIRLPALENNERPLQAVAMDCEMVYTTASMELARVVFTDVVGRVILDEYVLPSNTILDLNTRFSGIKEGELLEKGIDRAELSVKMQSLGITHSTIMVGHGLENDLNALRIVHTLLVDSAILFPHKAGLPYRNALKYLVKRYLSKDIQMNPINGQEAVGHDPAEDARSALELVIWKAVNGDKKVGDEPFSGKLK